MVELAIFSGTALGIFLSYSAWEVRMKKHDDKMFDEYVRHLDELSAIHDKWISHRMDNNSHDLSGDEYIFRAIERAPKP